MALRAAAEARGGRRRARRGRYLGLLAAASVATGTEARAGAPEGLCNAHVDVPPVQGQVREWRDEKQGDSQGQTGHSDGSYWDMRLQDGCSYAFWEQSQTAECLQGAWVILIGASNTNIWTIVLANLLASGALHTIRDKFAIDGVWTQLVDVIIEDGKVVYKQVILDPKSHEKVSITRRDGAHSEERDREMLKKAFASVSNAPSYSKKAIRITNFLAQFWESVPLAVDAVTGDRGWAEAEVTMAVSVGLWYKNNWQCTSMCTRPAYKHLTAQVLYDKYREGLRAALSSMERLCSPDGRASKRGCTVATIERCPLMKIPFWHKLRDNMALVMRNQSWASPLLRFVDLWQLTSQIPEACLQGHQTPMSTLLTWQVFLNGMCDPSKASKGTLVAFHGDKCRATQVTKRCNDGELRKQGFQYEWDCAVSTACEMKVVRQTEDMRVVGITGHEPDKASDEGNRSKVDEAMTSIAHQNVLEASHILINIADGIVRKDDATIPQDLLPSRSRVARSPARHPGARRGNTWFWPAVGVAVPSVAALAALAVAPRGGTDGRTAQRAEGDAAEGAERRSGALPCSWLWNRCGADGRACMCGRELEPMLLPSSDAA